MITICFEDCLCSRTSHVGWQRTGGQGATRLLSIPQSVTEEQRRRTVRCVPAFRENGLLPEAFVGSIVTARCGDAPASPPWPRAKSRAAGPVPLLKQALSNMLSLALFLIVCNIASANGFHYGFATNKLFLYEYSCVEYLGNLGLSSNLTKCDVVIERGSAFNNQKGIIALKICISNIFWRLDPLFQSQWKFGAEAAKEWKPLYFNINIDNTGRIIDTDFLESLSRYELPYEQKFLLTNSIILCRVIPFILSSLIVEMDYGSHGEVRFIPPKSDNESYLKYYEKLSWMPAYYNYYIKELNSGMKQLTQEITIVQRNNDDVSSRFVNRLLLYNEVDGIIREVQEKIEYRLKHSQLGTNNNTDVIKAVLKAVINK